MTSRAPKTFKTCRQADVTILDCLIDCEKDQARQQARRIGRATVLGPAPGGWERLVREPIALPVSPMSDVTRILSAIEQGDPLASEQLLPLSTATVYMHWNYVRAWLHGELLGTAES